jgi:hypothetical protein
MHRVGLVPVPPIVRAAAWIYVARRAAILTAVLGAIALALFIVLAGWLRTLLTE